MTAKLKPLKQRVGYHYAVVASMRMAPSLPGAVRYVLSEHFDKTRHVTPKLWLELHKDSAWRWPMRMGK